MPPSSSGAPQVEEPHLCGRFAMQQHMMNMLLTIHPVINDFHQGFMGDGPRVSTLPTARI